MNAGGPRDGPEKETDLSRNPPQVVTLVDVTTLFMNAGFAVGYAFGQMFRTSDEDVNTVLAELKKALNKKGLMPFTDLLFLLLISPAFAKPRETAIIIKIVDGG